MSAWMKIESETHYAKFEHKEPPGHPVLTAVCKWDGCVDLRVTYPWEEDSSPINDGQGFDYMHICDFAEFVDRMRRLRQEALLHFGDPWPY